MSTSEDEYFEELRNKQNNKNGTGAIGKDSASPAGAIRKDIIVPTPDFNIINIRNKLVKDGSYEPHVYTKEEIDEQLRGYILVPNELYKNVPRGSHVRYYTKDNKYHSHAWVKSNWVKDNKYKFQFESNKKIKRVNSGYFTWIVYHENISKLYKKPDPNSIIEINLLSNELILMKKKIKELESRLSLQIEK